MLKQPKYSKRINYNALKDLFGSAPNAARAENDDEKDDDEGQRLYSIGPNMEDEKDEGDGMVLEEPGGRVGVSRPEEGSGDEKEEEGGFGYGGGWEDGFEQEV